MSAPVASLRSRHDGDGDRPPPKPRPPAQRHAGEPETHRRSALGPPPEEPPRVSRPWPFPGQAVGRWLSRPSPGRSTGSVGWGEGAGHYVGARLLIRSPLIRRGVFAAAALLSAAGTAGASPKPTVSQVKAKLNKLTAQENWLIQRYDQASQDLSAARQRLKLVNQRIAQDQVLFHAMQGAIGQIASTAYESGSMTSPLGVLTSASPQTLLAQSAILTHLSTSRQQQLAQVNLTARALAAAKQTGQRTETAVASLRTQLASQKANLNKLITKQQSLLNTLTAQQQADLIGGGALAGGTNTVPTNTQAGKAVAFAFAAL